MMLLIGLMVMISGGMARAQEDGAVVAQDPASNPLLNPRCDEMKAQAPELFQARFETSNGGGFIVEVHREWAPRGADRFYNLVRHGFYDNCRFFRVVEGFMAQVGINGNPEIARAWRSGNIIDESVKMSNKRAYVTFAMGDQPHSRSTQIFINYRDNAYLDDSGFAPFGKVTKGMMIVDRLYSGYGDAPPRGRGPDQGRIQMEGNSYLEKEFPLLDYVKRAYIIEAKDADD